MTGEKRHKNETRRELGKQRGIKSQRSWKKPREKKDELGKGDIGREYSHERKYIVLDFLWLQ